MGRVQDKVCIVTGAASGIGKKSAELLAAEGGKLVLADIDTAAGEALAAELPDAIFQRCDVGAEPDWEALIAKTVAHYGGLDVLVNNAGIVILATIEDMTLEQWERINRVNNTSVFLGCKHGVAAMKEQKGRNGSIVNISSIAAMVGTPQYAAYSATKGAVRALTKSVALHCLQNGYPIRCNSVHPGVIDTPMVAAAMGEAGEDVVELAPGGVPAMGEPADVGRMVLHLASDDSMHVNGAEMVVDNGVLAGLGVG